MKILKKLFLIIMIALFIWGIYVFSLGYKLYNDVMENIDIEEKINEIQSEEKYVKFEDLSPKYIEAVIAVEDHRFYDHGAIDIISIARAIWKNISNMDLIEGGSTITQQVAKNVFLTQSRNIERKIAEIFIAYDLEELYDKNEIFEIYVNTSYFGNGYYGIGVASKGYYNKSPKALNFYESTMLAGVPNAPSVYAPTVNPELAERRREIVIETMAKFGYDVEEVE